MKSQLCSPALLRRVLKAPLVPHFALAHLKRELNWYLYVYGVALTDSLKLCVPAGYYDLE